DRRRTQPRQSAANPTMLQTRLHMRPRSSSPELKRKAINRLHGENCAELLGIWEAESFRASSDWTRLSLTQSRRANSSTDEQIDGRAGVQLERRFNSSQSVTGTPSTFQTGSRSSIIPIM